MQMSRKFDGKKFMWDGNEYNTEEDARKKEEQYSKDGFEVRVFKEGEKWYVFTRRVVKEVKIEGSS